MRRVSGSADQRVRDMRRMVSSEMKILEGKTERRTARSNGYIAIESICDVIPRSRLRWFGHILRRDRQDWLRIALEANDPKTRRETVREDLHLRDGN